MRHQKAGRKLGRPSGHRRALLRNLTTELIEHERITTTEPKAREIHRLAEKAITWGKQGSLHARRQALAYLTDERVVNKLFAEVAPRYAERSGGYTRIIKLGQRLGDGAPMAQLELVT